MTSLEQLALRSGLTVLVIASLGIYHLLNKRREPLHLLGTRFDAAMPFVPAFSVPYLAYFPYLFGILIYGIMLSPRYLEIAASALIVQLGAALTYRFYQTYVPRPMIKGRSWPERLTSFIYSFDRPYNTFPSLHAAYSLLCLYWTFFLFPVWFWFFATLTVAILASTLLLKQHVVADMGAGTALAGLAILLARLFVR